MECLIAAIRARIRSLGDYEVIAVDRHVDRCEILTGQISSKKQFSITIQEEV